MIKIGKYVDTHGIRGEIRLISDFSRKDLIFKKDFKIYINNKEFVIESYRKHKNFDMLKLIDINNINDIEYLKKNDVFINRNDIDVPFIDEDLINYTLIIKDTQYKIIDIINNKNQKILVLNDDRLIPYINEFIEKKDDINKKIYMNVPDGL